MEQTDGMETAASKPETNTLKICRKLLSDAIPDRLKKKEANSLITKFILLLASHFIHIRVRMAVTFVLSVLVYFINDFIDVEMEVAPTLWPEGHISRRCNSPEPRMWPLNKAHP